MQICRDFLHFCNILNKRLAMVFYINYYYNDILCNIEENNYEHHQNRRT